MIKLTLDGSLSCCTVVHQDDEVSFDLKTYKKTLWSKASMEDDAEDNMFGDINAFLKTLDNDDATALINTYREIKECMARNSGNDLLLNKRLATLTNRLYAIVTEYRFYKTWAPNILKLKAHSSIEVTTAEADNDRTYTQKEYVELANVSIALRLMIPVWGMFLSVSNTGEFKETHALQLLTRTWIFNSAPLKRLRRYFNHCSEEIATNVTLSMMNLSTDMIPEHLVGKVVVRRLVRSNVRDNNKPSIVSEIHMYGLMNKFGEKGAALIKALGGRTGTRHSSPSNEFENNISRQEMKRKTMEFSPGDRSMFRSFVTSQKHMILKEAPLFKAIADEDHYYQCFKKCYDYNSYIVWDMPYVKYIMQWVMGTVIPMDIMLSLDDNHSIQDNNDCDVHPIMISACQALLWVTGHEELAVLLQCTLNENNKTDHTDRRLSVAQNYRADLARLYPWIDTQGGSDIDATKRQLKDNPGITSVLEVSNQIPARNMDFNCCEALQGAFRTKLGFSEKASESFVVPLGVRDLLAKLAIQIAECN